MSSIFIELECPKCNRKISFEIDGIVYKSVYCKECSRLLCEGIEDHKLFE